MDRTYRGFSLIELMIVVAILAIVTTWAYGSYRDTVMKSHRAEGIGELLIIADRLERYYINQGTYAGASLGTSSGDVHKASSENGYYNFSIPSATTITFTISAAPQGTQANDTKCGTFSYNSVGTKSASGSLGAACW